MYRLTYLDNKEEKTIDKETEEHALEIFRRIASVYPNNYKVVSIVNLEELAQIKAYDDNKQNYINNVMTQINKIVK